MNPARRLLLTLAAIGDRVFGPRCHLCRERHRQLMAHLHIDHFGENA